MAIPELNALHRTALRSLQGTMCYEGYGVVRSPTYKTHTPACELYLPLGRKGFNKVSKIIPILKQSQGMRLDAPEAFAYFPL